MSLISFYFMPLNKRNVHESNCMTHGANKIDTDRFLCSYNDHIWIRDSIHKAEGALLKIMKTFFFANLFLFIVLYTPWSLLSDKQQATLEFVTCCSKIKNETLICRHSLATVVTPNKLPQHEWLTINGLAPVFLVLLHQGSVLLNLYKCLVCN